MRPNRRRRRHSAAVALATTLSLLVAAGPVRAGPLDAPARLSVAAGSPSVLVLVAGLDPPSRSRAGELEHLGEVAVASSGRFTLRRLVDAIDPRAADEREKKAAGASTAFAAGMKAYDELDTARAAEQFDAALKAYRLSDLSRTAAELSKTWVMRTAALVANGEINTARQEIEQIVAFDPAAEFSPNYFPPDLLKHVEASRRAAKAGKGELSVTTTPEGARVFLDGAYRGVSPLTVSGLPSGEHLLTLVAPGFALAQQPASLGANEVKLQPAEASDRWRAAVDRIALDPKGPSRDLAGRELGQRVGAEQVLLVLAAKSAAGERLEVTVVRLEVRDGHTAAFRGGELPLGEGLAQAAQALFAAALEKDDPREGGEPVKHYEGTGQGGTSRQRVGYALLASGGALLAGALYFGLQANGQAALFRTVPQTDEARSTQVRSAGQSYALVADLFLLGGLAAAGGGGFLAFAPSGPKAEPAPPPSRTAKAAPPARPAEPSAPRGPPEPKSERKKSLDDDLRNY